MVNKKNCYFRRSHFHVPSYVYLKVLNEMRRLKDNTISVESLRNTFYSRYESELKNLWQHSIFIWGFEVLLFTAYGYLVASFFLDIEKNTNLFVCNIVAIVFSFVGLCISAIWIALAKSTKTWQEYFEALIMNLEEDVDYFPFPRVLAMGGFHNRLSNIDQSLMTTNIGKFSPGKLNIFISQFVWIIWFCICIVHCLFFEPIIYKLIFVAFVFLLYLLFLILLKNMCSNCYFERETRGKEDAFENYLKIERLMPKLGKLNDVESLKDFVFKDLLACKLFSIDELASDYKDLMDDFKGKLINEEFSKNDSVIEFVNKLRCFLCDCMKVFRERYNEK